MIARGTTRHDHPILGAWRLDRRRAPQATARRLEDYPGGREARDTSDGVAKNAQTDFSAADKVCTESYRLDH